MSGRRTVSMETPQAASAPRWIPAYAALNTILLAFFIVMSVNIGSHRELGYKGPGLGAFREAFSSKGFPALATGARRIASFLNWGPKFVPEDQPSDQTGPESRLVEPPPKDLQQLMMQAAKTDEQMSIPLPIHYARQLDKDGRDRLSAAVRLIRQTDRSVMVCATVPADATDPEQAWVQATEWAATLARYMIEQERIPAGRVTAVGRVAMPEGKTADAQVPEPTVTLIVRPSPAAASGGPSSLQQKPKTTFRLSP